MSGEIPVSIVFPVPGRIDSDLVGTAREGCAVRLHASAIEIMLWSRHYPPPDFRWSRSFFSFLRILHAVEIGTSVGCVKRCVKRTRADAPGACNCWCVRASTLDAP